MNSWYKNSTLQMDDPEMQWLQGQDPASCAVWEWYKGDCSKRGDSAVRELSEIEMEVVSKRLGIDSPRFSQVSQNLRKVSWIKDNMLNGWDKWQGGRTNSEDAARKQAEYYRNKVKELRGVLPDSPTFSQNSPKSPNSPSRLDKKRIEEKRVQDTEDYGLSGTSPGHSGTENAAEVAIAPVCLKAKFKVPSREEVVAAMVEHGLPETEADKFLAYYESNGWKVGKNQMKSVNGAIGGWACRYKERNGITTKATAVQAPKKEFWQLDKERQFLQGQLNEIKDRVGLSAAGDFIWDSESQRSNYMTIKKKLKELTASMTSA